jgi:hypothetical protein
MTSIEKRLVIEQILCSDAGEHWFTDHHPTWREGPHDDRPCLSRSEAKAQRLSDVKMLRRHCKRNSRGLRLAGVIESCKPGHRCVSAACIECNRATQRLFVDAGEALLRSSSVSVTAMSVVFKGAWILQGRLINPSDLFESLSRRLRKALLVADIRQAFGGFDVSANEHACGGFSTHYRPHAYVFVPTRQMKRAERTLRAFFPASNAVRRPLVAFDFDGRRKGLAYALKRDFQRRVTLPRQALLDGSVKRRNTRDRPLRASQKVELGLVLNRLGLGTRVFLHGLKVVAQGNKIRIVRSTSERSHRESGAHHDATARPAARAGVDRMRTPSNAERAVRIRSHRHLLD